MATRKRFLINGLGMLALVLATALAAISISGQATARNGRDDEAKARLRNPAGNVIGEVKFKQEKDSVSVRVKVQGLTPGFHGFHIHTIGSCVAPDFVSAGGHLNPHGQSHPAHAGDMPVLLINADGSGEVRLTDGLFKVADLFDADGSAIIVHGGPDNYANIPSRYAPNGPDATTLATGDSGGRVACGAIEHDD
ncbi:MAG: superoxide dismutase family protein [Roseiflexaceae bacterium]